MLEIMLPWKEDIEETNESQFVRHLELVKECSGRSWRTFYEPIAVGCKGLAERSLCEVLSRLDVTGVAKKRAIKSKVAVVERG